MARHLERSYVFGYGSLISKESRLRSGLRGDGEVAVLHGYSRAWNVVADDLRMTALGIKKQVNGSVPGLLLIASDEDLAELDGRESIGPGGLYDRVLLHAEDLKCENQYWRDELPCWTYVTRAPRSPSVAFPVAQSYVDVVLAGCLEVGLEFARQFVLTTTGWDKAWVNDRHQPRYPRHASLISHWRDIDQLLASVIEYRIPQSGASDLPGDELTPTHNKLV